MEELIGLEINYGSEEYGSIGYPAVLSNKFVAFLAFSTMKEVSIELISGMRAVFIEKFVAIGVTKVCRLGLIEIYTSRYDVFFASGGYILILC